MNYYIFIQVRWSIIGRDNNADISTDVAFNQSRLVVFKEGQADSSIEIRVINDDVAELSETFQLRLLNADQDGEVDESNDQITFTIL